MKKPSTENMLEQAKQSILFTAVRPDIVMEKGKGMFLWDTNGKKYLDFIGGWAVNCLGHSPDVIAEAMKRQATELVNASPTFKAPFPPIALSDIFYVCRSRFRSAFTPIILPW